MQWFSIKTLNVNGLYNSQSEDLEWLNGAKNKTQCYFAYKKHTSPKNIPTHLLKINWGQKILYANGNQNRGVAALTSDKIDFKKKNCKKRQRKLWYNDKSVNSAKEYNDWL